MPITIHAMTVFTRVAEQSSFVSAARSLLIDPTNVSRTITALEKDLGVLLFTRSTRAARLTERVAASIAIVFPFCKDLAR